ncbi:MAG TPA: prepilin-type N-terminal cleavage/methylation domain-containing protein [Candidatus Wallbacteria bacterium]|nr:prepilin-type N-terminal cleavage/methylation domain-containing protein [Candidatus Wallbacteria bacterium]
MEKIIKPNKIKGFSLIELMIVIAILGILVGLGISQYSNASYDARRKRALSDVKNIADAIKSFNRIERKKFYQVKDLNQLLGKYIQKVPKDPWGHTYEVDGTYVYSLGEDGVKGKAYEYYDKFGARKTGSFSDYSANGSQLINEKPSDDIRTKYERDSIVGNPTFVATQNKEGVETPGNWKMNPEYDPQNTEVNKNYVKIDKSNTTYGGNSVVIK